MNVSSWRRKFAFAFNGLRTSVRTQTSFAVHLPIAIIVIIAAIALDIPPWGHATLVLAIAMVISAELLNTSIEELAAAVHPDQDPRVGHSLDAAAAGVLVTAVAAVAIGLIVLGPPLWDRVRVLLDG